MKAAFINSVAGFGSTGRLVEQLSQMPGIEGKIYYGRGSYTGPTPSCRFAGFFDNALQAADTFLFDRHALSNTRNTQKAMEDLKQFDYVYLFRVDDAFREQFGELFDNPQDIQNDTMFTVSFDEKEELAHLTLNQEMTSYGP